MKKFSEESIKKMSLAKLGVKRKKKFVDIIAKKHRKKVVQLDLEFNKIAIYHSIKQAMDITGIDRSLICNCCKNNYSIAKGYIFVYKSNYSKAKKAFEKNQKDFQKLLDKERSKSIIALGL